MGAQHRARLSQVFDRLDADGKGLLDRADLQRLLLDAAKTTRLPFCPVVIDAAIDALFEDVESDHATASLEMSLREIQNSNSTNVDDYEWDDDKEVNTNRTSYRCDQGGTINKAQFIHIFERHPDLTIIMEEPDLVLQRQRISRAAGTTSQQAARLWLQDINKVLRTSWRNNKVNILWFVIYAAATASAFAIKADNYAKHDRAQAVFGSCIVVARGSAQCLNLNCALILIPMARHAMTRIRLLPKIRHLFPFDSIVGIHILLGCAIMIWTVLHVGAHICDFHRLAHCPEADLRALLGNKLCQTFPISAWGRWNVVFASRVGVTGILMLLCMLVAYPMTLPRFRKTVRFNIFWTSHHLLLVMLGSLCFHGTGNLLEPFQSVYWLALPLALYLVPRVWRETPFSRANVQEAFVKPGGVLCLRLDKSQNGFWDSGLRAGMYAFVQVPICSKYEWHPFTLTSAPSDPFLEFHIRNDGDWTGKLFDHVRTLHTKALQYHETLDTSKCRDDDIEPIDDIVGDNAYDAVIDVNDSRKGCSNDGIAKNRDAFYAKATATATTTGRPIADTATCFPTPKTILDMVVKVDGPMGAPSQGFKDHKILLLVGAGIGVTPMISVLKELLVNPGKMKRVFFYWTVREHNAFEWFTSIMDSVYKKDQKHVMQVRHFLTSATDDHRDIGAVLLYHAKRSKHRSDNFDLILGQPTHHQVEVGRPDWKEELESVKQEAKGLGYHKCGIFVCASEAMTKAIESVSCELSRSDPDFHFDFNKETF